jgi:putative MATE family efflux protein
MGWPQMVAGVFNAADQLADMFWAGRVAGVDAIAGVGISQSFSRLVMLGRAGLDVGMQATIARAIGAQRADLANHAAFQAFTVAIGMLILIAFVGVVSAPFLLGLMDLGQAGVAQAVVYLQLQFVGVGVQGFRATAGGALLASGDVITHVQSTLASRIIHLVLTPFLVFGWLGAPEMGVAGAAVANIFGQLVGVAWNLRALHSGRTRLHLRLSAYRIDLPMIWRIVRIGVPAAITQAERGISEIALLWIISPFGATTIAAFALTRRLERVTNVGSNGMGKASGVLVGQNLGAGRPDRARSAVKWAVVYVTAVRGTAGGFLILFPAFFIAPFSGDSAFVEVATVWVRIQAVAGIALGAGQVFQQSFNVAGDTLAPMLVTLASVWALEVPAAFVLSRFTPAEAYGVAIAIALAMFFRLALYGGYYTTGRWLRVRVLEGALDPDTPAPK